MSRLVTTIIPSSFITSNYVCISGSPTWPDLKVGSLRLKSLVLFRKHEERKRLHAKDRRAIGRDDWIKCIACIGFPSPSRGSSLYFDRFLRCHSRKKTFPPRKTFEMFRPSSPKDHLWNESNVSLANSSVAESSRNDTR